jgi:flagellin
VASADMTGTAVGLLDSDTTNPAVNAFDVPAANRTLTLQYTDAGGTVRSVTLTQDPTSPGGLTFTNLAGGPEAAAPFTAFAPGAFQVTLKDTSGGVPSLSVTVAGGAYTAVRQGTTFIQTGALAGQQVVLDIPDLRAAALGHGAGLAAAGFASLQDLTDSAALTNGNADSALKVIDAAIQEVSAARGRAGAVQADALESGLNSLRTSSANLTSAESQLRDVDFAAASAAYARDNIIYQAATAMLAQANQVPQTILDLLKK